VPKLTAIHRAVNRINIWVVNEKQDKTGETKAGGYGFGY
jgi:hypothetical protein